MTTIATTNKQAPQTLVIAAFAALYIIWGSTYLGILFAMQSITPFYLLGIRFVFAGSILMAFGLIRGEELPSKQHLPKVMLCGILMLFMGNGSVVWGEQYLPSGIAAIVVATLPLWFVLLDKRNWTYNFSNYRILLGLVVGFAGVLLLFSGKGSSMFTGHAMQLISFVVLIVGSICWATGSLVAKYGEMSGSTVMKVAIQMLAAGVLSVVVGTAIGEQHQFHVHAITSKSAWAMIYLILIGSLVGYMSYIWLLSVRPPSLVGTYAYVNPVVAVFLGWIFAGELISTAQVYALLIILAGVVIVNLARSNA